MKSYKTSKSITIDRTRSLVEQPETGHNRWHPDIPPILWVRPGEIVGIETRDSMDGQITAESGIDAILNADAGRIHPLTGPIYVEGAEPGDLLQVEVVDVIPRAYGFAIQYHNYGFLRDHSPGPFLAHFELRDSFATSPQLPRVRFRAAPFMGVMGVAPSKKFLEESLKYETMLDVPGCKPTSSSSCIPATGDVARYGLRTIPPRSNGGNIDIPQLTAGSSVFIPVLVPGGLFSTGDAHFVQGESECVTGLEMSATLICRFHLHKQLANTLLVRDLQFKFSEPHSEPRKTKREFYGTTGQSFGYGDNPVHSDLHSAAKNALLNMINYLRNVYGYDFQQAYIICSLAVDLRISQAVNLPNFTVSAILDLGIFDLDATK